MTEEYFKEHAKFCNVCGCDPVMITWNGDNTYYQVVCRKCNHDGSYRQTKPCLTQEKALRIWNKMNRKIDKNIYQREIMIRKYMDYIKVPDIEESIAKDYPMLVVQFNNAAAEENRDRMAEIARQIMELEDE